jgi:sugar/nucleoside kinase (ribokinase family)
MVDVIVKPAGPLIRGADQHAIIRTLPGGSAANQALWLAHFGVSAVLAAKVAAADLGRYEGLMQRGNVIPRLRGHPDLPTGMLVTIVDADGQRSFLTDRGANDALDLEDLPDDLLDGAAVLHISGYALVASKSRAAVLDLIARARRLEITLTVDPGSASFLEEIGPACFLEWTKGADLFFPNEDEAAILVGERDPARQRARLAEYYSTTVIKRGSAGAEIVDRGKLYISVAPPPVEAVDTTGAGDAFLAAYLAAYLRHQGPEECLGRAIVAGSEATCFLGGQPQRSHIRKTPPPFAP